MSGYSAIKYLKILYWRNEAFGVYFITMQQNVREWLTDVCLINTLQAYLPVSDESLFGSAESAMPWEEYEEEIMKPYAEMSTEELQELRKQLSASTKSFRERI